MLAVTLSHRHLHTHWYTLSVTLTHWHTLTYTLSLSVTHHKLGENCIHTLNQASSATHTIWILLPPRGQDCYCPHYTTQYLSHSKFWVAAAYSSSQTCTAQHHTGNNFTVHLVCVLPCSLKSACCYYLLSDSDLGTDLRSAFCCLGVARLCLFRVYLWRESVPGADLGLFSVFSPEWLWLWLRWGMLNPASDVGGFGVALEGCLGEGGGKS